jgi:hypothetical protein
MEEWHQKLHNNTTPDDVPICSAYIAFLEVRGRVEGGLVGRGGGGGVRGPARGGQVQSVIVVAGRQAGNLGSTSGVNNSKLLLVGCGREHGFGQVHMLRGAGGAPT